ncbi:MAG: proline racemase family protein [Desulfovermiculus sp.]
MPPPDLSSGFHTRFPDKVVTIDSHTAGEPTRLVVGGLPPIPGEDMKTKREYFLTHLDHIRCLLTREPRGHRDIFAAVLTEPVSDHSAFGLIYMDPRRYPYLCGHATMGAVTTLLELGGIQALGPQGEITVDTPSGPMSATAVWDGHKVQGVTIQTVPSFVYRTDEEIHIPNADTILADTVCVGGFFAMVDIDQLDVTIEDTETLTSLGMEIIAQANRQLRVAHPSRPEVNSVDVVEFYTLNPSNPLAGQSVVIYGEAHVDRSPCGTGTAAKLTLLHHLGYVEPGQTYTNKSPTGTTFQAAIANTTYIGDLSGVEVRIQGTASITGRHEFVLDPHDPFPQGFLL